MGMGFYFAIDMTSVYKGTGILHVDFLSLPQNLTSSKLTGSSDGIEDALSPMQLSVS